MKKEKEGVENDIEKTKRKLAVESQVMLLDFTL